MPTICRTSITAKGFVTTSHDYRETPKQYRERKELGRRINKTDLMIPKRAYTPDLYIGCDVWHLPEQTQAAKQVCIGYIRQRVQEERNKSQRALSNAVMWEAELDTIIEMDAEQ